MRNSGIILKSFWQIMVFIFLQCMSDFKLQIRSVDQVYEIVYEYIKMCQISNFFKMEAPLVLFLCFFQLHIFHIHNLYRLLYYYSDQYFDNILIMNITKLSRKLILPSLSKQFQSYTFVNRASFHFYSTPIRRQPPSIQLTSRIIFNNSNKKPNKQTPPNWKSKFEETMKKLNERFDVVYNRKISLLQIAMGCMFGLTLYLIALQNFNQEVSMKQFENLLNANNFKEIRFVEEEYFYSKNIRVKKVQGKINDQTYFCYVNSFDQLYRKVIEHKDVAYTNQRRSGFDFFFQQFYIIMDTACLAIILGILYSKRKTMGSSALGMPSIKNKRFTVTKNINIKFNDVAGLHQVKRQVQQIVDFLKFPAKYTALGATIPKGILLTGPPGTGKTLLAKACAGQAGVPFYSVSGSDFVQMFVGVGASRVRQLFSEAKNSDSPAIIFIDELDAIGKKRMNKLGGNDERQSTLNQLLVEMDGFGTSNKVVVMGATNRKQILDQALVRPGRFDREVEVGLPDLKGRFQIFQVHLKPLKLSQKYTMQDYAKRLAALSPGFSGAEIANLCNQAAILSARQGKQVVEMIDFEISSERVIGGVERKGFVSLSQKKTVAYHECGHAVVSWFLQGADPLLKVTIIPRSKGALGFAQYFLDENELKTKQQILDKICFILGGRCAELHFFKEVTTGAYDDLSKAYDLAYSLIAKYGMSPQIGYISYPNIQYTKPYGEGLQSSIDREVKKIIQECTERTKQMVAKHEKDIKNLAQQLLVKQTLDVRSIQKILGKRPFPPNKTFQAYLETSDAV